MDRKAKLKLSGISYSGLGNSICLKNTLVILSIEIRPTIRPTRPLEPLCDPETEFTCGDGKCVDISGRCDRTKYDCEDGTDEYDCGMKS